MLSQSRRLSPGSFFADGWQLGTPFDLKASDRANASCDSHVLLKAKGRDSHGYSTTHHAPLFGSVARRWISDSQRRNRNSTARSTVPDASGAGRTARSTNCRPNHIRCLPPTLRRRSHSPATPGDLAGDRARASSIRRRPAPSQSIGPDGILASDGESQRCPSPMPPPANTVTDLVRSIAAATSQAEPGGENLVTGGALAR